ncbi:MAG TPA: hypothetical protein VGC23_04860 [Vicinamibacterales bacterium]
MARARPSIMTLDPTWLMLSLVPSGIGFILFTYGRKQQRWPHLAAGVLLMVYPYFATTVMSLVAAGAGIGFGLWYAVRLGW